MEIIVGSVTYRVHRVIMAAYSVYFRRAMSCQLKEAKENRVIIEDVDPVTMRTVIEFCYTNQVSLDDDNFSQVLSAAFRFCIESLRKVCIHFIEPRITVQNCTRLIPLFDDYRESLWRFHAMRRCMMNFGLISQSPEFVDMSERVWDLILPLHEIDLSESEIFRALVRWTKHDLENRQPAFERLVKHVRFATIDASELSELSGLELATMSESCKELIEKAKESCGNRLPEHARRS